MKSVLEVKEGTQYQSADETLVYTITTTNWESTPTTTTAVVYDESNKDTNVSTTVMPSGSHSEAADVITLKPLTALTVDHTYRVEVKFVIGSNTWECKFRVRCIM